MYDYSADLELGFNIGAGINGSINCIDVNANISLLEIHLARIGFSTKDQPTLGIGNADGSFHVENGADISISDRTGTEYGLGISQEQDVFSDSKHDIRSKNYNIDRLWIVSNSNRIKNSLEAESSVEVNNESGKKNINLAINNRSLIRLGLTLKIEEK